MEYFNSLDTFNINNKMVSESLNIFGNEIFYNKKLECLKIGSIYLFINENEVIDTSSIMLTEGILGTIGDAVGSVGKTIGKAVSNISWSSLIPSTTSDWIHLGVDVISGITDLIPVVGNGISAVIDLLHSIAYFIEAYFNKEERTQLIICGGITAFFALIPFVGNFGSIALKKSLQSGAKISKGGIIKAILNNTIGLPVTLVSKFTEFILNLPMIQQSALKVIMKYQDTWWFKGLIKLPIIKKMVNFVKNGLDKILITGSKMVKDDFAKYIANVSEALTIKASTVYKNSDDIIKNSISEEAFIKTYINKVNNKFGKEIIEGSSKNQDSMIKFYSEGGYKKIADFSNIAKEQVSKTILNNNILAKKYLTDTISDKMIPILEAKFAKNINEYIAKNGTKNIPYDTILKDTYKTLGKDMLRKFPKLLLKRGALIARKRLASAAFGPSDTEEEGTKLDSNRDNILDSNIDDNNVSSEILDDELTEMEQFASDNNLTVGEVYDTSEIGTLGIDFKTPDKQGENGKLIHGGGIFKQYDISSDMSLYTDQEDLLSDLKIIGKKSEDIERVRSGEFKKWEKTKKYTTPYIKSMDNTRYEFYYVIRERSDISFLKKTDIDSIDWADFIKDSIDDSGNFSDKFIHRFNSSLYLICNKIVK